MPWGDAEFSPHQTAEVGGVGIADLGADLGDVAAMVAEEPSRALQAQVLEVLLGRATEVGDEALEKPRPAQTDPIGEVVDGQGTMGVLVHPGAEVAPVGRQGRGRIKTLDATQDPLDGATGEDAVMVEEAGLGELTQMALHRFGIG